jgi:hypothetical protein
MTLTVICIEIPITAGADICEPMISDMARKMWSRMDVLRFYREAGSQAEQRQG